MRLTECGHIYGNLLERTIAGVTKFRIKENSLAAHRKQPSPERRCLPLVTDVAQQLVKCRRCIKWPAPTHSQLEVISSVSLLRLRHTCYSSVTQLILIGTTQQDRAGRRAYVIRMSATPSSSPHF